LQDAERAAGMNAKLRKKGDHAARVGFRIAAARVRIQAEAMASRYLRRIRRRGWMFESAGDREVSMRAMSMWSDYGTPVQRRWWKSPRRSTRSSTGLKILLAAGVVVAGVIGISGVYPQVIDAEWVQGARTYASRTPAPDAKITTPDVKMTRRSDIPASVQPVPIAATTSQAAVATPRPAAQPAAAVPTPRAAAAASKPLPVEAEPPALAEIPDASANADEPPKPASTVAAKPASPVVKRRVTRVERPRRAAPGAFAFGWGGSPFRM
jgi:hypothetical protein